ncbi:MAG: CNNM domain-containing protein [Planctomycetota bacterium]
MEFFWLMWLSILLAALFAGSEIGVYAYKPSMEDRKSRAGRFMVAFLARKESLVALCLVAHNLFLYSATLSFESMLDVMGLHGQSRFILDAAIFAPVMFLVGDVYPKGLFKVHAKTLMPKLVGVFVIFKTLLLPIYLAIQLLIRVLHMLFKGGNDDLGITPQHIHWLIQDQVTASSDTSRIVSRIMGLSHLPISALMEPLSRVKSIVSTTPHHEVRSLFLEGGDERILVRDAQDGGLIVGVVSLNDALLAESGTAGSLARQIPTLQHKANVHDALRTLRDAGSPLCRVQASTGATLGVLYTRRIVSEIVGDGGHW